MNPSNLVERWQLVQAINADSELKGSALKVAVALMGFVNSQTGECYPTFEKIMAACHVSKATVVRATQTLESRGWVAIERDVGGDRESNRYHFAFDRIREGGSRALAVPEAPDVADGPEIHGIKIEPCSDVHGVKSEPSTVSNFSVHGLKMTPELEEDNSIKETQESLFGEEGLQEGKPFDLEAWFEQQWWPQYPLKVEKIAAKKLIRAIIEGRCRDGLKATPQELLAGVMRYAAAMTGKERRYIKHPTTWLNKGCWTDEHAEPAGFDGRAAARTEAVWSAINTMPARNRRAG